MCEPPVVNRDEINRHIPAPPWEIRRRIFLSALRERGYLPIPWKTLADVRRQFGLPEESDA